MLVEEIGRSCFPMLAGSFFVCGWYEFMDKYVDDINVDELADTIQRVYRVLTYESDYRSDELDELTYSHTPLVNVLSNASEHVSEIMLLARMLNTPQSETDERERKNTLEDLLRLAGINDFPAQDVLLPPSEWDALAEDLIKFYSEYDPNEFLLSEDGWIRDDQMIGFGDISAMIEKDPKPLFSDLHLITSDETVPDTYSEQAYTFYKWNCSHSACKW